MSQKKKKRKKKKTQPHSTVWEMRLSFNSQLYNEKSYDILQPSVRALERGEDEAAVTAADPEIAQMGVFKAATQVRAFNSSRTHSSQKRESPYQPSQHDSPRPLLCQSLKQLFSNFNVYIRISLGSC